MEFSFFLSKNPITAKNLLFVVYFFFVFDAAEGFDVFLLVLKS